MIDFTDIIKLIMNIFWCVWALYSVLIVRFFKRMLAKLRRNDRDYSTLPEEYQPFIRYDYRNWSHLEIYFGAIFLLPIRLLGVALTLIPCLIILRVGSLGMSLK
jgi:hypothetical protein